MAFPWYQSTAAAGTIPPHVAERALEWLIDLQGDSVPPEVIESWLCWRSAHPDHERAWQRIESVKGRLQPLSSPLSLDIAQVALAPPASEQRRRALKALAVVTFASGLTWTARDFLPWRTWSADYRTAVGERRTLTLDDGTQLHLNTASAVDIRYGETERRVKLIAGEILVTTAPDSLPAARPFLVETAQGTARAVGTRYVVRQRADDSEVAVFAGAVEIRPRGGAGQATLLHAGFSASYTADAVTSPHLADTSNITWAEGFIVARSMRLDDFIVELRRYTNDAVSCDPSLAGTKVSGSFPVDDIDKVLAALSSTLDVRTETTTRLWGQRSRRLVPAPGARSL